MGRATGRFKTRAVEKTSSTVAGLPVTLGPQHCRMYHLGLTCGFSGLLPKKPGLAAWDGLELSILWGWRQALGSGSQECIKVLQPCDLEDKRIEKLPSTCNL